ncbi:hypothetical protein HNY73_019098 [Argiope bruennichi]|uniref:Uncharacterized protein n=1 Tax=Argiope bruennichi TaxID=94029 RepID=A0A8T0EK39_ARGBR|nr:hypothetical protein HNY73_019098 [Argiope bruennichi]
MKPVLQCYFPPLELLVGGFKRPPVNESPYDLALTDTLLKRLHLKALCERIQPPNHLLNSKIVLSRT